VQVTQWPLSKKRLILCLGAAGIAALAWWLWTTFLGGLWHELLIWLMRKQNALHRELAHAIRLVAQQGAGGGATAAAWSLITLSFAYGIFHAAGPGHGKAIIATYLGTNRTQLGRGLLLSLLSALMQGLTAIVLVEVLVGVLGHTLRRTQGAALQLEALSFALIALLGALLTLRSAFALIHHWQAPPPAPMFSSNGPAGLGSGLKSDWGKPRTGNSGKPGRLQAFCADCAGFFQLKQSHLKQKLSWRSGLPIVLAIGLRPCTGAVLVLMIAHTLGLRWVGMAAVLAMSVGTAMTIALLALAVISLRQGLLHRLQRKSRPRMSRLFDALGLTGGLAILLLGIGLLRQALAVVNHPLL